MSPPNDRDEAILEHVRRYHLTTAEVLKRHFFAETNDAAVRKVVSRLIHERRLRAFNLFDNRKYYVLTPREAVARGEHRCIALEFNYQGFVNAYAVLCFCMSQGVEIFTAKEFEEKFPDLHIRGVRSRNYFIDRAGENNRLGFIHVDYGSNPERIAKKVQRIISRGYTLPAFTRLIQRRRFIVAVLTPSEKKRAQIMAAIEADPPQFVEVRVAAVPELRDVLLNRKKIKTTVPKQGDAEQADDPEDAAAEPEPQAWDAPQGWNPSRGLDASQGSQTP